MYKREVEPMFRGLFQPMHLIIILVIVLIIFGPSRLGEIGKGLGESIRGFKKSMSEDDKEDTKETPKQIASSTAMEMKQETTSQETVEARKETV
jgi:sec-independent protein translocase protein TatA